jgi:hypothetical protein
VRARYSVARNREFYQRSDRIGSAFAETRPDDSLGARLELLHRRSARRSARRAAGCPARPRDHGLRTPPSSAIRKNARRLSKKTRTVRTNEVRRVSNEPPAVAAVAVVFFAVAVAVAVFWRRPARSFG